MTPSSSLKPPSRKSRQELQEYCPPLRNRFAVRLSFLLLAAAMIGMVLVNIWTGEAEVAKVVTPSVVFKVIATHLTGLHPDGAAIPRYLDALVWETRVPRAIGGALVGMLLALAGVAFQSLLMNPLADPYMVGVSAGSALGSVLVILLGGAGLLLGMAQPLAALGTGLLTMTVVYMLARLGGRLSSQTFLLAGIVVGTFLWSLIQMTLALAFRTRDPSKATEILAQQLGSLTGVGWKSIGLLLPFGIIGAIIIGLSWREMNLMAHGEESAAHQGVDAETFKRKVILAGSLVTAAAVSVSGIIAFVGMVVPHIARRVVGTPNHRIVLPAAMLIGGLTLSLTDWLARVFFNGLEIGVITSLIGAPVFCYLLRRRMISR